MCTGKKFFAFWYLTTYIENNRAATPLTKKDPPEERYYGHN